MLELGTGGVENPSVMFDSWNLAVSYVAAVGRSREANLLFDANFQARISGSWWLVFLVSWNNGWCSSFVHASNVGLEVMCNCDY